MCLQELVDFRDLVAFLALLPPSGAAAVKACMSIEKR
jgi:hypothetical protein